MQKPKEKMRTPEQFKNEHILDIHNYSINNQFTFDDKIKSEYVNYQLSLLNKYINNYNLKIELEFSFGVTYNQVMLNEEPDKYCNITAVIDEEVFYLTSKQDINLNAEYSRLCALEYERLTNIEFDKYTTRKAKETLPAVKNIYNSKVVSLGSTIRYEHMFDNVQCYNAEGFDVVNEDNSISESKFVKLTSEQIEEMDKEEYLNVLASNSVLQEKVKNIYSEEDRQRARASMSKKRQQELIDNVALNADSLKNPRHDLKFVTFTFDDHITNPSVGWDELSKFNKRLKRYLEKYYKLHKNFRYVAVIEPTKNGGVHIHIIFFDLGFIKKSVLQCIWKNINIEVNEDIEISDIEEYWDSIKKEDKQPFSHYQMLFEKIELLKQKNDNLTWFDNETICDLYQYFPSTDNVKKGLVDIRAVYDEAQKENMSIAQYVGKTIASYVGKTIALSYENEHEKNDWFGKRLISYSQNCKRVETSRIMHDQKSFKNQEHYEKFLDELSKLGTSKLKQSLDINKMIEDGYCVAAIKHNQQLAREQKKYSMLNYYDNLIEQYTYHKLIVEINKRDYKTLCKKYGVIGFSYQSLEKNVKAKKRKQLEVAKRSLNTIEEAKEKYDIRQTRKDKMEVKKRASETQSNITEFKQMTRDEFFNKI